MSLWGSWAECKDLVLGYSGARYKGFFTRGDAEQYMSENAIGEGWHSPRDKEGEGEGEGVGESDREIVPSTVSESTTWNGDVSMEGESVYSRGVSSTSSSNSDGGREYGTIGVQRRRERRRERADRVRAEWESETCVRAIPGPITSAHGHMCSFDMETGLEALEALAESPVDSACLFPEYVGPRPSAASRPTNLYQPSGGVEVGPERESERDRERVRERDTLAEIAKREREVAEAERATLARKQEELAKKQQMLERQERELEERERRLEKREKKREKEWERERPLPSSVSVGHRPLPMMRGANRAMMSSMGDAAWGAPEVVAVSSRERERERPSKGASGAGDRADRAREWERERPGADRADRAREWDDQRGRGVLPSQDGIVHDQKLTRDFRTFNIAAKLKDTCLSETLRDLAPYYAMHIPARGNNRKCIHDKFSKLCHLVLPGPVPGTTRVTAYERCIECTPGRLTQFTCGGMYDKAIEEDERGVATYIAFTDGACSNNQSKKKAKAGSGVHFVYPDSARCRIPDIQVPLPGQVQTNQRAELHAFMLACRALKTSIGSDRRARREGDIQPPRPVVFICSDSKYTLGLAGHWKAKENTKDVSMLRYELAGLRNLATVVLVYTPGHSGIAENEEADQLAVMGSQL
ncbi:hypothetical protein KIPB_002366 [Kipferlia bialata]|uniref:ribonuclease H n=1 Tax=Kipferlia bialata TaxID=797122 RepID=A0A9K3CS57_9EUKA|nr:hypothetical protein KIPB_002366 [Kipferlia bialata]|eukprot:g2366.t1